MKREIKVGLTVLGAILLLYFSVAWVKQMHLFAPSEYGYQLHFENVNGLLEGDPVNVRGFPAGRVHRIIPLADKVLVEVTVDQRIPLYQDARAEIQVKELMGGKQVSIMPGRRTPALQEGDTLQGFTSLDFSSSFSQVGQVVDRMEEVDLQPLLQKADSIADFVSAIATELDPVALGQLVHSLNRSAGRLERMLQTAEERQLVQRVDQSLTQLNALGAQAQTLLTRVDSLSDQIKLGPLAQVDSLLSGAGETLQQANQLIGQVQQVMEDLNSDEALAGKMLRDPAFARKVDSTLVHLTQTLEMIQSRKIIVGFRRKQKE